MDDQDLRKKNLSTVKKVIGDALGTQYPPETLYAPGATFHQPFFFPGKVTYINDPPEDGSDSLSHEETVAIFRDWEYGASEYIETTDPGCIIVRNAGRGKVLREDGKYYDYANEYVHIFYLEDGLITRYYEYTNPLKLMDAFGIDHPDLPQPEETDAKYRALGIL